jgi:hypothetical protein
MTITDLTEREQAAVDWAHVKYSWPGATSQEGFEHIIGVYVEQWAKEMDNDNYAKSYADFQTLPPAKQEEIKQDIEASKPVVEQKPPGVEEPAPKKVNR